MLKLLFWNVSGFVNLAEHDNLAEFDIICISETMLEINRPERLPCCVQDYNNHWSNATREADRGRASGGLLTLVRKNLSYECIAVSNFWIFIKVNSKYGTLIIGNVYFRPTNINMSAVLKDLQVTRDNCELMYNADFFFLGGDFNAKLGRAYLNYAPSELFDGTYLDSDCDLSDLGFNDRGNLITDFMTSNGFVLVNGRSCSDKPAKITFANHNGKSIIDLMWLKAVGISSVTDFFVEPRASGSEHSPISLFLWGSRLVADDAPKYRMQNNRKVFIPKWQPSETVKITKFQSIMRSSCSVSVDFQNDSTEFLHQNLINTIVKACSEVGLGITKTEGKSISTNERPNKPWYDKKCCELRKGFVESVNSCFKTNFGLIIAWQEKSPELINIRKRKSILENLGMILKM